MALIPKSVIKKINRFAGKAALKLKKHLPDILMIASAGASAGAVVASAIESAKLDPVLDDAKQQVEVIHETVAEAENREIALSDAKKDLTRVYISTAWKLTKLYIPAATLELLSWACMFSGHKIMRRRNMELSAAYAAVFNAFQAYRSRVKEKYGEDVDYDLLHNTTTREVIDSETGEVTKVREFNSDPESYLEVFDSSNPDWDINPHYCKNTLMGVQTYANDLLQSRGYVFWNEIKEELHMPIDTRGAVVGWVLDGEDSDKYVDLRIQAVDHIGPSGIAETWFTLDPNVDGTIIYNLDKIGKAAN